MCFPASFVLNASKSVRTGSKLKPRAIGEPIKSKRRIEIDGTISAIINAPISWPRRSLSLFILYHLRTDGLCDGRGDGELRFLFLLYFAKPSNPPNTTTSMDNITVPVNSTVPPPFEVYGVDGNLLTAYAALLLMAAVPIYIGSWRSLKQPSQVNNEDNTKDTATVLSQFGNRSKHTRRRGNSTVHTARTARVVRWRM